MAEIKSGRLSIDRSPYDLEPEDKPPALISFTMRGRRGAVLGRETIVSKQAFVHFRKLGRLLGSDAIVERLAKSDDPTVSRLSKRQLEAIVSEIIKDS